MNKLTINQAPVNETYEVTGPNEPNTAILTYSNGLILKHKAYPTYTVSEFNKDIVIDNNGIVELATPHDTNIVSAGTIIKIDSNGITFC